MLDDTATVGGYRPRVDWWVDLIAIPVAVLSVLAVIMLIGSVADRIHVGTFRIAEPINGTTTTEPWITVRGVTEPLSSVTHDTPARGVPKERLGTSEDGTWEMRVPLKVGENVLTFWLHKKRLSTRTDILIIRDPAPQSP